MIIARIGSFFKMHITAQPTVEKGCRNPTAQALLFYIVYSALEIVESAFELVESVDEFLDKGGKFFCRHAVCIEGDGKGVVFVDEQDNKLYNIRYGGDFMTKTRKTLLCALICFILILTCAVTAFAAQNTAAIKPISTETVQNPPS